MQPTTDGLASPRPAQDGTRPRPHEKTKKPGAGRNKRGMPHEPRRRRDRVWAAGRALWLCDQPPGAGKPGRKPENAGHRRRHSGRRTGLSPAPVCHHRRGRGACRSHRRADPAPAARPRLCHRRGAFGSGRVHRHDRLGARQRAHRRRRAGRAATGPDPRVPVGRDHRDAGGRPCPAGDRRVLCRAGRPAGAGAGKPHGDHRAHHAGAGRLAGVDLRAAGRGHLHQGRRRGRRSGRQGRGRDSGRRSAQPGGDRRQRG